MPRCRTPEVIPSISQQKCTSCGELRKSGWYSKKNNRTGLQLICRPCAALYLREMRKINKAHLEAQGTPITEKRCSVCEMTLPAGHFHKESASKDGRSSRCISCRTAQKVANSAKRRKRSQDGTLVIAAHTERVCVICNTCKPWAEYFRFIGSDIGIVTYCKACSSNDYRERRSRRKETGMGIHRL